MKYIVKKLDEVHSLIDDSEFVLAFILLNEIIIDNRITKEQIADAINLKGLIIAAYCLGLTEYEEDETGLKYFIEAFTYNPYELGILFNVLSSFSELDLRQAYTRNNKHAFVKAYSILKNELFDTLDSKMQEQLDRKAYQYDKFKKEGF